MTEPMPTRYHTSANIPILVRITCERCGHAYTSAQEVVATSSYPLDVKAAEASALDSLNSQIQRLKLGDYGALDGAACPKCAYVQSWMLENRVRSARQVVGYVSGALAAVVLLLLGLTGRLGVRTALAAPLALVVGVLVLYAARPLVGWLYRGKRRAAARYPSRLPTIELAGKAPR